MANLNNAYFCSFLKTTQNALSIPREIAMETFRATAHSICTPSTETVQVSTYRHHVWSRIVKVPDAVSQRQLLTWPHPQHLYTVPCRFFREGQQDYHQYREQKIKAVT